MDRRGHSGALRLGFQVIVAVTVWSANALSQNPFDYVPNLPYTAQFAQTYFETLPNGIQVLRESRFVQMRDSQGRTRIESFPPSRFDDPNQPTTVNLYVPLLRQFVQLNPGTKTARVMTFPGTGPIPTHGSNLNAVETTTENLPGQMVHGVYAIGTRTTQRMPSDDSKGPDVVDVQESWISPDLKIVVLAKYKSTAPGSDNPMWEIQKLDRGEPEAALFEIPKDYKIVTATFDWSKPDSPSDASNRR